MHKVPRTLAPLRGLPRQGFAWRLAAPGLRRTPCRAFANIQVKKGPHPNESDESKDRFNRYRPDQPFHFDSAGLATLYVFNNGRPQIPVFLVLVVAGLCLYQIIWRWERSGIFANVVCSILVVPAVFLSGKGITQMGRCVRWMKIDRSGKTLVYKTFLSVQPQRLAIREILMTKTSSSNVDGMDPDEVLTPEEVEANKEEGAQFEHQVTYGSGKYILIHTFEKEGLNYLMDKDVFRAAIYGREIDFSRSSD